MNLNEKLHLEVGESIILGKKTGGKRVEFSLHVDPILDNIVEMWIYDQKKSKPKKSKWIILKDLPNFLNSYISMGYEVLTHGTITSINNKNK